MRILVSGCTATAGAVAKKHPDRIGELLTPSSGNKIPEKGAIWAADNDCFAGLNAPKYLRFVSRILASDSRPLWITCPDSVANMGETWRLYNRWAPMLHDVGLPVALVCQDGLEKLKWRGPWNSTLDEVAAIFIGGSTAWKLSPHADRCIIEAKERGKLVHVGRVNSRRRIEHFAPMGVDSIDGSGWSRWGEKRIRRGVRWIDRALRPGLFKAAG